MGASVKGRLAVELQLLINMEQTEDDENPSYGHAWIVVIFLIWYFFLIF